MNQPPTDKAVEAELRAKAEKLVMDILARGRLNQQEIEGRLNVRDMGINARKAFFVNDIMALIKSSNLELLDRIDAKIVGYMEVGDPDNIKHDDQQQRFGRNKLRVEQRQALASIRKEYE